MTKDKNIKEEQTGGFSTVTNTLSYINQHVIFLNNNKFFAGLVMILLNIGSKFIMVEFSKSTQEYMKYTVCKQILVFAMAWMGTRDIYTSLGLTAIFTILSEYLFNEESQLCVVPPEYRVLHKLADTNNDGVVTDTELSAAMAVLEKAKKDKQKKDQKEAYLKFDYKQYN